MISEISKSLTTALLLAVSFNNLYASNINLNNSNNIVQNEINTNNTDYVITQNNIPLINMQKVVKMDAQKASDVICTKIPKFKQFLMLIIII